MKIDWSKCAYPTANGGIATFNCIPLLVANIIYWLLVLAGSASLVFIIIGGIRFIISGGDTKKIDQARKTIIYAILGLILIVSAFLIVNTVGAVTGVTCFKDFTFTSCQ